MLKSKVTLRSLPDTERARLNIHKENTYANSFIGVQAIISKSASYWI